MADIAAPEIRRIVVAIDSSDHGRAALEAAVRLAERLDAEIDAVFVEDENLVRLANLPFGREFRSGSGEPVAFDVTVMEERFRVERHRAHHAYRAVTERVRVRSAFRVARGGVTAQLLAAAENADLIVLGIAGLQTAGGRALGSNALVIAARSKTSVLLMRRGASLAGKPLVYFDGGEGSRKALALAMRIADGDQAVRVLIVAAEEPVQQRLRTEAAGLLSAAGLGARIADAAEPDMADLCSLASATEADVLLIAADNPLVADEGRAALLRTIACPVLLVH